MERSIGATYLRQHLPDVLLTVRDRGETYVIETFGRPQAAVIGLEEYQQFLRFRRKREAFLDQLETTATRNAERNAGLSDKEVLSIIEQAREQVASGAR